MENILCKTGLSTAEINSLEIGQKLLLHTKEGYCSLIAKVSVSGKVGAVGCEVMIDGILDPCTENNSKTGDTIWADFRDLAIIF